MISPRAEMVSPRAEMVSPRAEMVSPRAEMVSPRAEMVSPRAEMVSPREVFKSDGAFWAANRAFLAENRPFCPENARSCPFWPLPGPRTGKSAENHLRPGPGVQPGYFMLRTNCRQAGAPTRPFGNFAPAEASTRLTAATPPHKIGQDDNETGNYQSAIGSAQSPHGGPAGEGAVEGSDADRAQGLY